MNIMISAVQEEIKTCRPLSCVYITIIKVSMNDLLISISVFEFLKDTISSPGDTLCDEKRVNQTPLMEVF